MCCCCCDCCDFILTVLAFICPPLTVGIKRGFCSCDFLINIALCFLGYVPGLIHAWYIVLTDDDRVQDDLERQIFVVSPTQTIMVQPQPCTVTFTHSEPFETSRTNSSSLNPPTAQHDNLSPLSSPSAHMSKHEEANTSAAYGSTDQNDVPQEAPPSYDTVMKETAQKYGHS